MPPRREKASTDRRQKLKTSARHQPSQRQSSLQVIHEDALTAAQEDEENADLDDTGARDDEPEGGEEEEEEEERDGEGEEEGREGEEDADAVAPACCTPLIGSPAYPDAVKWSDDNLLAIATSNIVTILNPAFIDGPRNFIGASTEQPLHVGCVRLQDRKAQCLLPVSLSRDGRGVVRSLDWSPQGLASNGGCLLAVCTRNHRVKLYRAPFFEFQAEWIEILDLSEMLGSLLFGERLNAAATMSSPNQDLQNGVNSWTGRSKRSQPSSEEPKHWKTQKSREEYVDNANGGRIIPLSTSGISHDQDVQLPDLPETSITKIIEPCPRSKVQDLNLLAVVPLSNSMEATNAQTNSEIVSSMPSLPAITEHGPAPDHHKHVLENMCRPNDDSISSTHICPSEYRSYANRLACTVVAWSSTFMVDCGDKRLAKERTEKIVLMAMGTKSGEVSVSRAVPPTAYAIDSVSSTPTVNIVGVFEAHKSWVSALAWSKRYQTRYSMDGSATKVHYEQVLLATGSCDGSVNLWVGDAQDFMRTLPSSRTVPLSLLQKVVLEDCVPVTAIAMMALNRSSEVVQVAVGKGSGSLMAFEVREAKTDCRTAQKADAHSMLITGIVWAFDGQCLYSTSQDDSLRVWMFIGRELLSRNFPCGFLLGDTSSTEKSCNLPDSVFDGYYGLAISKGCLALATVRGVDKELVDQMYQSRTMKAMAQVYWVGSQQVTADIPVTLKHIKHKISDSDLVQWKSRLLTALHHFENSATPLVLWDVVTCLTSLLTCAGSEFVKSVIAEWLLSLEIVKSASDKDLMLSESYERSLRSANSRCLQIVCVIFRHLCKSVNGKTLVDVDSAGAESSSSGNPDKVCWRLLSDVEHELRQRLVILTLNSVISSLNKGQHKDSFDGMNLMSVMCMLQWVAANSFRLPPHLLGKAQTVAENLKTYPQTELCSICGAKVPYLSTETGECEGISHHKLPRCATSFRLCPSDALWFCNCCARRASKQTPVSFLTLSSGHSADQLVESLSLDDVEPVCPFCGILMQKFLPDCFLRLSLV